MLDKIENKLIDGLNEIDIMTVSDLFDCKHDDVSDLLTNYFNKREYFKGNIDLTGIRGLKSLGKIKRVDGDLKVGYSDMENLGNLKIVKGMFKILPCMIESTGKLLHCGGLYITGKRFKKINKLTEVNGMFVMHDTSVETLNNLQLIGGDLKLTYNKKLATLGDVREVNGDVVIHKCDDLTSLGLLYHIGGSLDVRYAKLQSFGNLKELNGFVITLKSTVNNLYNSGLSIIDFKPLISIFPKMPKAMHLKVPKIDNLKDFGMIVIDDDNDNIFSI